MRAILTSFALFCGVFTGVMASSEPGVALNTKWSQRDLRIFEDFFFEIGEDGHLNSRELGQLPEERLGALRKLSLDSQLKDFIEEKQDDRWRMALGRLLALDSLLKASIAGGLWFWDLRVRRTAAQSNSSGPQSPQLPKNEMSEGEVSNGCKDQVIELASSSGGRPGHNGKRHPSLVATILRLGIAGSFGAWLSWDLYQASQYQGVDLSMQWIQDQSQEVDMKKNLGDQLSSLQTSSLFEDLKAHLKQKGLNDVYLARVIAPFSESDLWSGAAKKAFVVINHEGDKSIPTVTVELSWNQSRGSWTYSNSWFGTVENPLNEKPF